MVRLRDPTERFSWSRFDHSEDALERAAFHGAAAHSMGAQGLVRNVARTGGRPAPPDRWQRLWHRLLDAPVAVVTAELVRAGDLIVVMDAIQRRMICERFGRALRDVVLLGDLNLERVTSQAI